jgi:hypothetical protein
MKKTRPLWHTLTPLMALGATIAFVAPDPIADACSVAGPRTVGAVLGLAEWTEEEVAIPGNAASLDAERGELFVSAGATLYRIPPETSELVVGEGRSIPVSAELDTVAPSLSFEGASWVESVACGGCQYAGGGVNTSHVSLAASAEDDVASAEQITYAVYFGATAEEARDASLGEPELWVLPDYVGLWFYLAEEEVPGFIVVRAFDQAGNASAASAPLAVER